MGCIRSLGPLFVYNKEEPQTINNNGWGASQIKSMKPKSS